jgi:hypothetical protein
MTRVRTRARKAAFTVAASAPGSTPSTSYGEGRACTRVRKRVLVCVRVRVSQLLSRLQLRAAARGGGSEALRCAQPGAACAGAGMPRTAQRRSVDSCNVDTPALGEQRGARATLLLCGRV